MAGFRSILFTNTLRYPLNRSSTQKSILQHLILLLVSRSKVSPVYFPPNGERSRTIPLESCWSNVFLSSFLIRRARPPWPTVGMGIPWGLIYKGQESHFIG